MQGFQFYFLCLVARWASKFTFWSSYFWFICRFQSCKGLLGVNKWIIAVLFLSFLLWSSLFIITIKGFASLSAYLYFSMTAKIWLAFCLRRSHLLSLGMFYTKRAKSWEGFANFKGHHSFYQYHLEEWQKQQRSNSNNNKKKLVPNNKNVPRQDTVSAGQTWDDRWRAVREENITQRKDKCQLETQMMQPYLNFLGN